MLLNTYNIIFIVFLILPIVYLTYKRNLSYLHIFQQQEYNNTRFLQWIISNFAIDKKLTTALTLSLLGFYYLSTALIKYHANLLIINITIISSILLLFFAYTENNPIHKAKKCLIMTARIKRILCISMFISIILNAFLLINLDLPNPTNPNPLIGFFYYLITTIQIIPFSIVLSNTLLLPIEKYTQQKYWQEAKEKILTYKPTIIGITGSFGKTSVKHFLGHILQQVNHTLITSGSINTSMGIARTIREELNSYHKYFVVEMGAYGIGSIKNLCELTVPDFGIITALGLAHYERFKDLESVAAAKLELATAIINNSTNNLSNVNRTNKNIVIPQNILTSNYAKQFVTQQKEFFNILTEHQIFNIKQSKNGIAFDLIINDTTYSIIAPIFGIHNVINIAIAFLAAYTLGIPPNIIITAIKNMPQIKHRLEVTKQGNCVIIDDSYNANPDGFKSALELLSLFKEPEGRRILVTPGIIELGTKHDSEHLILGEYAAMHVDLAIIINHIRIPSFITGFLRKKNQTTNYESLSLIKMPCFKSAKKWLDLNIQNKDTILFANDLPDLYETKLKL